MCPRMRTTDRRNVGRAHAAKETGNGAVLGDSRRVVESPTPLEKLKLYDRAVAPDRLTLSQAKELRKHLSEVVHESDDYPNYEGRLGASAREIKTVLFNAAQSEKYKCLNAQAVLEELEASRATRRSTSSCSRRSSTAITTMMSS